MARVTKPGTVKGMVQTYWTSFWRSRQHAMGLDAWVTGKQYDYTDDPDSPYYGRPYSPKSDTSDEYQNLSALSPSAFGGLVVKTLAQTAYVEGVRMPKSQTNLESWRTWQQNRMDSKQSSIFRAAIGHGAAYCGAIPGSDPLLGGKMAKYVPRSAKRMATFYDDDNDEWPRLAIEAEEYEVRSTGAFSTIERGWNITVWDETALHYLTLKGPGVMNPDDLTYITFEEHGLKVCPVARCVNSVDLDGRTTGEIEPVLPLLRRIDQDVFDRLIVQRFGAWAIRYIAGLAKPENAQEEAAQALALRIDDLLISPDKDTKFGTMGTTDVGPFAAVTDADLRILAAITQTPPHHLLGLSSNLQAEALAAAESGLQRKSGDFRMHAGEFTEQLMRLGATITGNREEAAAFDMQVRWKDTEARSFQSTVQALGMAATQLQIPVEMLWERIPDWTDSDTERAKTLVQNGAFEAMIQELVGGDNPQQQDTSGNGDNPPA